MYVVRVQSQVQIDDEITQRMAVVEAGMRVQKSLGGSFTTPLAEAISALRKLNSVVNVAKHVDVDDAHNHGGLTSKSGDEQLCPKEYTTDTKHTEEAEHNAKEQAELPAAYCV